MFCHAIIGTSTGKERIMKVDVSAEFISPLLSFSLRDINFCVMKVRKKWFACRIKIIGMVSVQCIMFQVNESGK